MHFPLTQVEWQEILTRLYKRAAADHQFHILCMRDCHSAIKLICGLDIPKSFALRFEPQHSDEVVLVLPRANKELFHELSDQDFSQLAEGMAQVCVTMMHTQASHA